MLSYCKPMMSKPPPFKGLNIRIPIIIPIQERGLIMGLHYLPMLQKSKASLCGSPDPNPPCPPPKKKRYKHSVLGASPTSTQSSANSLVFGTNVTIALIKGWQ